VLEPLFGPIVVSSVLAGLVAVDAWLVVHGLSGSVTKVIASPALMLALLAVSIVSLFWHECGHAAACRYGGAKPGAIGAGIYLVWPVFYTDVTDSYRLDRRGRLRTDLGGVYFNAIFALAGAGAYFATASPPLLLIVVTQQLMMLEQFMPWVRLDGYYVISDLIGVSNLFGRIKPVMLSFRPGRRPDSRVRELKPWARVTVTAWVLTTVPALAAVLVVVILNAPRMLATAGQSFLTQLGGFADGLEAGDPIAALAGLVSAGMLVLPPLGLTLMYLLLCRRAGVSLAIARARAAVRPPPAPDPPAPPPA